MCAYNCSTYMWGYTYGLFFNDSSYISQNLIKHFKFFKCLISSNAYKEPFSVGIPNNTRKTIRSLTRTLETLQQSIVSIVFSYRSTATE